MFKGYDKFTQTNGGESYAQYLEHEQRMQGKGSISRHGVYLAHEEKMEIRYIGNICERVGWNEGDVLKVEEWEPVAKNRHAITGEQLTKEHSKGIKQEDGSYKIISDRKMHCDTTVSMPKAFSLLYALAGEHRVLDWHHEALKKGLGEWAGIIGCQANNRNGSKGHMEITGKYAGTHALHFFSRNGDPNIHSHIDIANVTEGANGKLYAIDFRNLMDHYGYLTSVYRDELARLAWEAGYEVVKGQYEEPQIAPLLEMCPKYSSRSEEIDQVVDQIEEHAGLKLEEFEKDFIVRATRGLDWEKFQKLWAVEKPTLRTGLDPDIRRETLKALVAIVNKCSDQRVSRESADELLEKVLVKMTADEIQTCQQVVKVEPLEKPLEHGPLSDSIEFAIGHLFHGRSVVKERDFLKTVINHAQGTGVRTDELKAMIQFDPRLIAGEYGEVACAEHYRQERECELLLEQGRRSGVSIGLDGIDKRLNKAQYDSARALLRSRERFTALESSAGVGKSEYVLPVLIMQNLKAGRNVRIVAPTDDAARLLREAADNLPPEMAGAAKVMRRAENLQLFQANPRLHNQLSKGDLLICDEASFVSLKRGYWLMKYAKQKDLRVCVSGDCSQGYPIEAGDWFSFMIKKGIFRADLHEIKRQTPEALDGLYLEAVKDLKKPGTTLVGLQKLHVAGCFTELRGKSKIEAMADQVMECRAAGINYLISHVTHRENGEITEAIRERRKALGELTDERQFHVYETLGWSPEQKKETHKIEVGMVLEESRGKEKGRAWYVFSNQNGTVKARTLGGLVREFKPEHCNSFDVCREKTMPIAVGDWLLSRSKHKRDGLRNQERVHVDGFDVDGNPIGNGKSITHRNLTYGEAFTVRAVQGSSTTMIISGMDRHSTKNWTREIAYVVASRGREYCKFFVESIVDLAGVQRSGARMAATEMVLKDGQVLQSDVTRLIWQIDKVKAAQPLQKRPIDLQAGKRAGEKKKAKGMNMEMEPAMKMNAAAYYQASAQSQEIGRGTGMER